MGTHPIFESDFDCLTDEYLINRENAAFRITSKYAKCGSQLHRSRN